MDPRTILGAPVIDLGYAQYRGVFDSVNNITSYLGIRYAAPPLGDLRWRAPQPPTDNSSTVQLANTQPLPCFQAGVGLAPNSLEVLERRASIGDPIEDCLFLNVYFPGDTVPADPLPTLVWIHGGGYVMGGADEYPGSDLMREANNGIVLVIIQYRLGIFGFLAGSKVKENGTLNAGLREQYDFGNWRSDFYVPSQLIRILHYDGYRLISHNLVGILQKLPSGENLLAGAGSVVQHIVAQDGQTSPQLFRGAITSSTFLPSQYVYNDAIPELLYSKVVSQAECSSADDSLTCLRAVDAVTLETLNNNIIAGGFYGTFLFVPVVDGTFIMQRPTEALAQGKVNGKALLSITNANEGTIFVNQIDPITNVSLYSSMLFPDFESQQADDTAELYANLGSPLEQDDLIMGESIFICPTYYLLNAFPDSGWKGEFVVPPATHGADVVYYYTSIGVPDFPNPDFLAAFQGTFMSFVVSQDPNDKIYTTITPSWNLYSKGNTEMIFNRTVDYRPDIHVNSTDNGLLERCNLIIGTGRVRALLPDPPSKSMKKVVLTSAMLTSAVALLYASTLARASNSDVPVINLGYTQYQGVFDSVNNLTNYLGIRYAAPPTGDLRWRAPRSPASNDSFVQQADTEPSPCLQSSGGAASTNTLELSKRSGVDVTGEPTEDCLFLNVYFPGNTVPTELLPTLVWIHGGGYIGGSADQYSGSDLMREANNEIVVVIIQYRLGLFGFLSGSEVKANGSLNAGLRKSISHISKFGGDPSKVTIWGESAGAGSVLQHIVAQNGQTSPQLFRGAITSSTFLPSQYMYNDAIPEVKITPSSLISLTAHSSHSLCIQRLFPKRSLHPVLAYNSDNADCVCFDNDSCTSAKDSLACLRAVDAAALEIVNGNVNEAGFYGTFVFVPVIDGSFITQRPTEALKQGKVNGEALLAVTNSNEGVIFVNQSNPIPASLYASNLFPKFGTEVANITAQIYAPFGYSFEQDELIMGESIFICPTYYLLSAFQNKAWKGEFAIPPATHGSDAPYYFPSVESPPFNNSDFLAAFQGGFMSFVVSQDPNEKIAQTITPFWDLYSKNNMEMVFNKTIDNQTDIHVDSTANPLLERCKFWNDLGKLTGQ
ncbi:Alpha/Beta hydrolase protein [Lentinula aff. lateritia]|uniref:Alpha/Beta hydrolase protein n=1 Tax=Lentinula aff. lateritia TaxID=2804960 RepID=A0ACC1U410_9AGAR|nr:Alpha/Beta hydrolase protein [Lentinula aff. lateritia]